MISTELSGIYGFSRIMFPVLEEADFSSVSQQLDFAY